MSVTANSLMFSLMTLPPKYLHFNEKRATLIMSTSTYPNEDTARRDIIEAGRRMYERGYIYGTDGNISARLSDSEIIITPSGVSKGFLTDDMLIKLDLDGNQIGGHMYPSSEAKLHLGVYKTSTSIVSVCHAHPPIATTFAAAGIPLNRAYLQESVMLLGVIPIARYAAPGSDELAKAAAAFCIDYHGVLLEHHGVATWGTGVMQGLYRMESVEYTATVAMYSRMMGFTRTLDNEKIKELTEMRSNWGITAALGSFE